MNTIFLMLLALTNRGFFAFRGILFVFLLDSLTFTAGYILAILCT